MSNRCPLPNSEESFPLPDQLETSAAFSSPISEMDELRHSIVLFMLAHIAVAESADRALGLFDMHRTHHRILHLCAQRPGQTVGDVVRILRLTPQAVQAPMRVLIKNNWLEQKRSETDKRKRQLYLTGLGWSMHKKLTNEQLRLLFEARRHVGKKNFDGFLSTLRALASDTDLALLDLTESTVHPPVAPTTSN